MKGVVKRYLKQQCHAGNIVAFVFFMLFALSMVYALLWATMSSLKDHIEYTINKSTFFPKNWLFSNYIEAFRLLNVRGKTIFDMLWNSVWLTVFKSLISMAVCCTTAYIMSKYDFVGKKVINVVILVSLMLPLYGSMASTLKLYIQLGMYNSPLILIASASGIGGMYLILRSYFDGVSWEYAEAAKMDGASELDIYIRIMLPIAVPAVGSILLVMMIQGWNDYATSIYYMPDYPTIASGLYTYEQISSFNVNYPVYFAGVILSCIPTMILFCVFQEKIMNSITTGGLKG